MKNGCPGTLPILNFLEKSKCQGNFPLLTTSVGVQIKECFTSSEKKKAKKQTTKTRELLLNNRVNKEQTTARTFE